MESGAGGESGQPGSTDNLMSVPTRATALDAVEISTADLVRRQLWDMPKDMLPLMREQRVKYRTRAGKLTQYRDLAVVKAPNAKAMVQKSKEIIGHAAIGPGKLLKMMRFGRENFGRDFVTERTRGGLRAFRYRSGMRDLRNETKSRRVEKRIPDHKRKRARWVPLKYKRAKYIGKGKYKKA